MGYNFGLFRVSDAHAVVFESHDGTRTAIRQCETAEEAEILANRLDDYIEPPISLPQKNDGDFPGKEEGYIDLPQKMRDTIEFQFVPRKSLLN